MLPVEYAQATPTIPHKLRHLKASAFQYGIAYAAAVHGRRGSNVYEVNPWLWQFGRGMPRLGGLSVSETEDRREAVVRAGAKRSQETRRRREAARRGDEWDVWPKYLWRDFPGYPRLCKFMILILAYRGICKF